jgi:hypothetical protein
VQDPYAKRFMKDEKITKTAYIANSGGLLGLCMGFSLGMRTLSTWETAPSRCTAKKNRIKIGDFEKKLNFK